MPDELKYICCHYFIVTQVSIEPIVAYAKFSVGGGYSPHTMINKAVPNTANPAH